MVDLRPEFLSTGGPGHFFTDSGLPMPLREGIGIDLDCPCGCSRRLFVPFRNPISPGREYEGWERTGETFDTLTLHPSILRSPRSCPNSWHGHIINGEVIKSPR